MTMLLMLVLAGVRLDEPDLTAYEAPEEVSNYDVPSRVMIFPSLLLSDTIESHRCNSDGRQNS